MPDLTGLLTVLLALALLCLHPAGRRGLAGLLCGGDPPPERVGPERPIATPGHRTSSRREIGPTFTAFHQAAGVAALWARTSRAMA